MKEGEIEPKAAKGQRTVPIASKLYGYLFEWRIRAADPEGLVFGNGEEPFEPSPLRGALARRGRRRD